MAKKTNKQVLDRAYGSEPEWSGNEETIIDAINWYVTTSDKRNYKKWTLDWVKDDRSSWSKEDYDYIRRNANKSFRRIGHYCRMLSRDYPQVDQLTKIVNEELLSMIETGKSKKVIAEEKGVVSPHDRILNQVHELACDMNLFVDEVNESIRKETDLHKKADVFKWLKGKSVGHRQARLLADVFQPNLKELDTLIKGKDKDLKEGYSYLSRPQQKKYHAFVKSIIDECIRYSEETKPMIVRKKRRRDPSKVVSKVKYLEASSEFGIRSEPPQDIIDSKKVVVFNTKYRVLSVYCSKDNDTMSVKGTTILNYDEEKSESRTIKKPKALIKTIKNEKSLDKVWSSQTSVVKKPNGRLNEFTVIVKVFK